MPTMELMTFPGVDNSAQVREFRLKMLKKSAENLKKQKKAKEQARRVLIVAAARRS